MKKPTFFLISSFLIIQSILAQEASSGFGFDFNKLKPIVQVFGTAHYDINNQIYDFHFGRTHVGLQYQYDKAWSAKIIFDSGKPTTVGNISVTDSSGQKFIVSNSAKEGANYTMYLKFASLQWRPTEKLTLEGGAILQNHYITQERFWGYRYVAQTFQDLYWGLPSTDLGFIAFYKISKTFAFDLAVTNGEGPRIKQDEFGNVKLAGGFDFNPSEKFTGRIFYHSKADEETTEQMFSVFAGWKPASVFRLGAEMNLMKNLQNIADLNSYGYSVFGTLNLKPSLEVFGRVDRLLYDIPKNSTVSGFNNLWAVITGVAVTPIKGINCSLNYLGQLPDGEKMVHGINLSFEFKI